MRLATIVMFGAGYVLGTKAGRDRYAQIVKVAQKTSERLDEFSARHDTYARDSGNNAGDRDARRQEAAL